MSVSVIDPKRKGLAQNSRAEPLFVLKFGSSVLHKHEDFPRIASELYRHRRKGRRVIAIVSALDGETDRLLEEASDLACGLKCAGLADLVSLGEERTAALLRIACDRIGLPAAICRPEDLGLRVKGQSLASRPEALEGKALGTKLEDTGLVIVPGFVGLSPEGERTLLARGGSDFSAIFIGGELRADCVRLYKDVDGVFESDPAVNPAAKRFDEISWNDALTIARPLIQPDSVEYAAEKRLIVEIGAIGSGHRTRVGPVTLPSSNVVDRRPIRVSLAGYGVVGQAVARKLAQEPGLELAGVLCRDLDRSRAFPLPPNATTDLPKFLSIETDIVVDVLSCEHTGIRVSGQALPEGVHVVSASKRAIAGAFGPLHAASRAARAQLCFSAAVGGGAPILETIAEARSASPIREFNGVLNGTVNFILAELAQGKSFVNALDSARIAGFAEEDSSADLSGSDAAAKLKLVVAAAFDCEPARVEVDAEPLDQKKVSEISASGERWIQLATAEHNGNGITAKIRLVPSSLAPKQLVRDGEWNSAVITLVNGGSLSCIGRGAGGLATAEAVIADIFDVVDSMGRPACATQEPVAA